MQEQDKIKNESQQAIAAIRQTLVSLHELTVKSDKNLSFFYSLIHDTLLWTKEEELTSQMCKNLKELVTKVESKASPLCPKVIRRARKKLLIYGFRVAP